jgi:hypothetical protein
LSFEFQLTQIDMKHVEHLPPAIPHTYFPVHRDCRVTFYQDAHQVPGGVPAVPLATCVEMPHPETLHAFASLSRYAPPLVLSGSTSCKSCMFYTWSSTSETHTSFRRTLLFTTCTACASQHAALALQNFEIPSLPCSPRGLNMHNAGIDLMNGDG